MQRYCIDKNVIGTDRHLLVDGDRLTVVKEHPEHTFVFSGVKNERCKNSLDALMFLSNVSVDTSPPPRYVKQMNSLINDDVNVPWGKVMPFREHSSFVKKIINEVSSNLNNLTVDYYKNTWCAGCDVFSALGRACVDNAAWQRLMDVGQGNVPAIRSFEPRFDGYVDKVAYDRFKTCTGRLVVKSGPQILTVKREHKSMLRSRYGDDGAVVSLDFAALEARILLYEQGKRCDDVDLYGSIANELGHDRRLIKGAVISEMYGSSKRALGEFLGIRGKELNSFMKKMKLYFNTFELLERVKKDYVRSGYLTNRYGRRIFMNEPLDHLFISYYGQSTGVDVTLLGFKQIIERLASEAPSAVPIFLLHDAIIIDCKKADVDSVRNIGSVKVSGYVQSFPLKFDIIS